MPAFCFLFVLCNVYIYSSIAQSVEHAAVNRRVVGSSPTGGAISEALSLNGFRAFSFFKTPRNLRVSNILSNACLTLFSSLI